MEGKKIGVLGSGIVGKVLGAGFLKKGYEVMMGTSDPAKLEDWSNENPAGSIGSMSEAADYADIVVLAVKGSAADSVIKSIRQSISGKIVIDATNPISDSPPAYGLVNFFTDLKSSLMELLQASAPEAHFVKAWNSIGNAEMVDPQFDAKPTMFICGNDAVSKETVSGILESFGFEVEDMGGVESARIIEPLCILWCVPGFNGKGWNHALRLMR